MADKKDQLKYHNKKIHSTQPILKLSHFILEILWNIYIKKNRLPQFLNKQQAKELLLAQIKHSSLPQSRTETSTS